MATGPSLWQRLPVIVQAVTAGMLAAAVGIVPWTLLVGANQEFIPSVPWAVPVMALYLALLWRYAPRTNLRAHRLSDEVWGAALLAGALGLTALVLFLGVMNRLVRLPAQPTEELSQLPLVTLLILLLMGSVVAGVVEEASFRGYMQGPIERRHGPVIAILVTGSLFGFAHFTHPDVTLILMPYYLAAAAVYGALAYLTNSIFPSMVLHAGGDVLSYMDLMARGRAEWQAPPTPEPLIWDTGADASFWISAAATLIVGAGTVWAYHALARVARRAGGHHPREGQ